MRSQICTILFLQYNHLQYSSQIPYCDFSAPPGDSSWFCRLGQFFRFMLGKVMHHRIVWGFEFLMIHRSELQIREHQPSVSWLSALQRDWDNGKWAQWWQVRLSTGSVFMEGQGLCSHWGFSVRWCQTVGRVPISASVPPHSHLWQAAVLYHLPLSLGDRQPVVWCH